jgi:anaerobic glycerol-3-phosphate dehydrogenase
MIEMDTEVLIVGGGMAGCAAAFAAAQSRFTTLISAGGSATSLSSGCIDFHDGADRRAAEDLLDAIDSTGLRLVDGCSVVTGVGLEKPTAIHQRGMLTFSEAEAAGRVDILHLPWLRSSHPRLATHCLRTAGVASDVIFADEKARRLMLERGDAEAVGRALASCIPLGTGIVAMPPPWPGLDYNAVLESATRESGREFRELVDPSGPQGARLQHAAERSCSAARLMLGTELRCLEFENDRCVAATVRSGLRDIRIKCEGVVMATGGPLISRPEGNCSLEVEMIELPGFGAPASFLRSRNGYAVHKGRAISNIVVCGSALPGKGYLDGYGLGDCIISGIEASERLEADR